MKLVGEIQITKEKITASDFKLEFSNEEGAPDYETDILILNNVNFGRVYYYNFGNYIRMELSSDDLIMVGFIQASLSKNKPIQLGDHIFNVLDWKRVGITNMSIIYNITIGGNHD